MESGSLEQRKMITEKLLNTPISNQRGGFRTLPFIIATEAFESVATIGLAPNMILYLTREYGLGLIQGTNIILIWTSASSFLPVLGAFLCDSFVGRFRMIAFGSVITLLGTIVLWLTATIPQARPSCGQFAEHCQSATTYQLVFLCSAFGLLSIGGGGIRSSSLAFGADQVTHNTDTERNSGLLQSFFSWYYVATCVGALVAVTGVVSIQDSMGWQVGFGVPVVLMLFSVLLFLLASPFYVKVRANSSLLTGFAQVLVASYKNRDLSVSSESTTQRYYHKGDSVLTMPCDKISFLNKACIIRNPEHDLNPDGRASDPWSLCTVEQVEELKALIKVIPIWSTGIMVSVCVNQNTFATLQAASMDRHVTSSYKFPAGSFSSFLIISLTVGIALYDRVILPLASKIMGKPVRLGVRERMGLGILFCCLSMAVSAIVESVRREIAANNGISDDLEAIVPMSAMWLIPQFCLNGLAEGFNAISQNEFYYSEFPRSMSSIASTLFGLGMGAASLLSSLIIRSVDSATRTWGGESWIPSNINKGHYDYYYGLLACLCLVNFWYFVICFRAYGPCEDGTSKIWDEVEKEVRDDDV
ncbi:Proton-dependent oligopeptide transporter family [Dillenia turbinata]|uniref:Proton-dependent oligopeptide transporter family n=1 Tax=Dillenia turbinata TaxID=194707 RepID=A0AAN8YU51_9MAGN